MPSSISLPTISLPSNSNGMLQNNGAGVLSWSFANTFISSVVNKSASFTVNIATDKGKIFVCDASGGPIVATFSGATAGFYFLLNKVDGGASQVSTSPAFPSPLTFSGQTMLIFYNGTTWECQFWQENDLSVGGVFDSVVQLQMADGASLLLDTSSTSSIVSDGHGNVTFSANGIDFNCSISAVTFQMTDGGSNAGAIGNDSYHSGHVRLYTGDLTGSYIGFFSEDSSAPSNTITPVGWTTVDINGTTYKIPLYQ